MLDEDSVVLESWEGMRTEADETDNLKGGGPWEKPKVPMKPNLGGTPV